MAFEVPTAPTVSDDVPTLDRLAIPTLLVRQAERHGDRPLLIGEGACFSYRQLAAATAARAGQLTDAGIVPGDRVALLCGNRPDLLEWILAATWCGAIAVPINAAARGEQLEHVLRNSGARLLIVDGALTPALCDVRDPLAELELVVPVRGHASVSGPLAGRLGDLPDTGEQQAPAQAGGAGIAAILYTSGTTGPSKGACCPHAQLFWLATLTARHLGIREGDRLFTCLPVFHINALTAFLQALITGSTFILGERFSASRFWKHVRDADATVTYLLGAMVSILARAEPGADDRRHHVRVALAPATPAPLVEPFHARFGVRLVEGYASTESNLAIGADAGDQRPGRMGKVVDGFAVRVADEHDAEVPDGTAGELLVRTQIPYAMAAGYWRLPEQTVEAWRNLWLHTGDRVVRHPDGWFEFVDRLKDSIRRRGENISSFEVERVLVEHPRVRTAAVFPVPSELGEDDVMASVVLADAKDFDVVDLIRHCEPRLAYFAIPRYVDVVAALPVTESGKVKKFVLRERGVTDSAWDREAAGYELRRDRTVARP